MPRSSPYPGFKPLNDRRLELVRRHYQRALSDDERRELKMLDEVTSAMVDYRWPTKTWVEIAERVDRLGTRRRKARRGRKSKRSKRRTR